MKLIAAIALATYLTGCASIEEIEVLRDGSNQVAKEQAAAAMAQPPTYSMKCEGPCQSSYLDPRDRIRVVGSKVTGTNDVIIGVAPAVTTSVGYISGAVAATSIIRNIADSMGGGNTTTHSTNVTNGDGNTNNQTTDLGVDTSNSVYTNKESRDNITSRAKIIRYETY